MECDGHDFHERTKEQASSDKKRDRSLQAAGFLVPFASAVLTSGAMYSGVQLKHSRH